MRTLDDLHSFQVSAIGRCLRWPSSMMLLDVGLGKTIIALTAIERLLDTCQVYGVLVVSTKRIVQTVWKQEARKWAHTEHLRFSTVRGSIAAREKFLDRRADIYLINYEQLTPFIYDNLEKKWKKRGRKPPFNMIIFDEVSKMSNPHAQRCMALRHMLKWDWIDWRMGLTASPATNGLMKLYGEYLALDDGAHLGKDENAFRFNYFTHNQYAKTWTPDKGAMQKIFRKVKHMTYAVENKLDVPPVSYVNVPVTLSAAGMDIYEDLEKNFFAELDSGEKIEVFNAAARTVKCLQAANGSLYVDEPGATVKGERRYEVVHSDKLDALEELMEEMQGYPVLICYSFRMDKTRLYTRFSHKYVIKDISEFKDAADAVSLMRQGKLDILTGHPASMAHGIDGLQDNCHHIIWYGLNWNLELYEQAIGRLHRQGQTMPVVVHRILATDTMDFAVLEALEGKSQTQRDFLTILRDYSRLKDENNTIDSRFDDLDSNQPGDGPVSIGHTSATV